MSKSNNRFATLCEALAPVGLLLIVVATLMPLFNGGFAHLDTLRWLYSAGALWLLVCRLFSPYRGSDLRLRRLMRMQSWSALFFVAGAVFLFMPGTSPRDWLALTMAGGVIQIIASLMITTRMAKMAREGKE